MALRLGRDPARRAGEWRSLTVEVRQAHPYGVVEVGVAVWVRSVSRLEALEQRSPGMPLPYVRFTQARRFLAALRWFVEEHDLGDAGAVIRGLT